MTDTDRRFQMMFGEGSDGAGYVIVDSTKTGHGWRGEVVFKSDSRGDTERKADRLNEDAIEMHDDSRIQTDMVVVTNNVVSALAAALEKYDAYPDRDHCSEVAEAARALYEQVTS